ncbi:MAG TPA: hypothetical protein VLB80_01515 [Candidatus Babeliales bacterium]|nr:hypothetical protein [Candidatus Babeliales bacterium]
MIQSGKKYILFFFISTISLVSIILSMEQLNTEYNYNLYNNHIIRYTHQINIHLLDAYLSNNNHESQEKIIQSKIYIDRLKCEITNLYKFKQSKIKGLFETLTYYGNETTNNFINSTIIPQLSQDENANTVTNIINEILLFFTNLNCQLEMINKHIDQNIFKSNLYDILITYNMFLSIFKLELPINKPSPSTSINNNETVTSRMSSCIEPIIISFLSAINDYIPKNDITKNNSLESLKKKIQVLFDQKKILQEKVKNKPSSSSKKIISTISTVTKTITSMPFSERLCGWAANNNNRIIQELISYAYGEKKYNEIKTTIFPIIKALHDRQLIRFLASNIHNFLENPIIKNILDVIIENQDEQNLITYSNNLQTYYFIELLESLYTSHTGSFKTLQQYNRQYQTVIDSLQKNTTIIHQEKPKADADFIDIYFLLIEKNDLVKKQKELTSQLRVIESNKNSICKDIILHQKEQKSNNVILKSCLDITKEFFVSLSPWYNIQNISTIENFHQASSNIDINNKELSEQINYINVEISNYKNNIKECLKSMTQAHLDLETKYKKKYKKYQKTQTYLPQTWPEVIKNINTLYVNIQNLKKENDTISWFYIWRKIINTREINEETNLLQTYITTYNTIKIKTHTKMQKYQLIRTDFLNNFKLTYEESHKIFNLPTTNDSLNYPYIFNPLEREILQQAS